MRSPISRCWNDNRAWLWPGVLLPYLATRLAWIAVAAFTRATFLPNPTYQQFFQRGGQLTRIFLLDIFAHWDSRWYLSIARSGYPARTNLADQYTSIAFFPLYPYLARGLGWLGFKLPDSFILLTGLVISNACFLAAMVLLYRLATRRLAISEDAARRAIWLIFAFPASFYFSSFYTESLFLFLCILVFTLAFAQRWFWAGIAAALAALTRFPGLLAVLAAGWIYMDCRQWRVKAVRADLLWLGLAPLALGTHLFYLYRLTGDFLAPFTAVTAWGRGQYSLLEGFWLNISGPGLDVFKIDAILGLVFVVTAVWMLFRYPSKVWGLFALALALMPLSSGLFVSLGRYLAVDFPVFLALGDRIKNRSLFYITLAVSFALQVAMFAAWVNFYWVD
jgi:hypothetical protein